MSWQAGAFTILAVALAAGFAWYERQRPDARIVALVATLAAFAALGRVAFAALPNIKPTTDIVLIAGYALGGAPGFAVGALAGLSSNFFFGQGPWTPWQMAAWGATGLIGAVLARLVGQRLNRWVLAAVVRRRGVRVRSFPGCGRLGDIQRPQPRPARRLCRQGSRVRCRPRGRLRRVRARVRTRTRPLDRPLLGQAAGHVGAAGARAGGGRLAACRAGPRAGIEQPGRLPAVGPERRRGVGLIAWRRLVGAVLRLGARSGLASAGYNPAQLHHGGPSLADYLVSTEGSANDPGSVERTILALRAAGQPVGGLLGQLHFRGDGSVSQQANLTAFAILAFRAAGTAPPATSVSWLMRQQDRDGGFNYGTRGGPSDIDDTGAVLEALAGTGFSGAGRAIHFIEAHENADGGFPSQPGASSNAQSTAWAVQGLIASGISPTRPLSYLRSLIAPDGHVRYSTGLDQTPVWVTAQALMALQGKSLPLAPVAASAAPAAAAPRATQTATRPHAATHAARRRAAIPAQPLAQFARVFAVAEALALAPVG